MKQSSPTLGVLSGSFLIAGTAIGAGMLGFPLITGLAGFVPASVITLFVWLYMLLTGFLLLEVALSMPKGSHILSMSEKCLGTTGKYMAGGMFIFLYYCIMIAYFAAGSPLLVSVIPIGTSPWLRNLAFGVIFGTIIAVGPRSINRVNVILTVAMILSWVLLIGSGVSEVRFSNLESINFAPAVLGAPILFSAFGYHNIIPPLCTYMDKKRSALRLAILIGVTIPLIVYLLWQWLIIGTISPEFLQKTLEVGAPVTAALESIAAKPWIPLLGRFFAFFAIVTSTLGVGFSLVEFLGDGLKMSRKGMSRIYLTLLTFVPPYILASINPRIFDTALGIAGGFGEAFLNGMLPVFLVWTFRYTLKENKSIEVRGGKPMLLFLLSISFIVFCIEVYHLFLQRR